MRMRLLLLAGLGALTLGMVAPSAHAAPPGPKVAAAVEKEASADGLVQQVHRRYRYYRYHDYRHYRYDDYYYRPYRYYDYRPYRYRYYNYYH